MRGTQGASPASATPKLCLSFPGYKTGMLSSLTSECHRKDLGRCKGFELRTWNLRSGFKGWPWVNPTTSPNVW